MIRIALVDDHPIVREGVRLVLSQDAGILVAFEANSGEELLAALPGQPVDVIILDLSMPGLSGVALVAEVHRQARDAKILVLTIHNNPNLIQKCLAAGASGYISKECVPVDMIQAVHQVHEHGHYLSPDWEREFKGQESVETKSELPLSKREMEVYRLLAEGLSPTAIAETLSISIKTVSTHKKNIFKKMGFHNMSDLVKYSIKYSL